MTAILRSVLSISALNVLSRITGYARTMVQASVLGTGAVANAYVVSSIMPNLLFELFLGGIIYSVFIPVFVERLTSHGEEDARQLVNALATIVLPLLVVVSAVALVFAGPLVELITDWQGAENLSVEKARKTVDYTVFLFRIFVLQIVFYGVAGIATAVLNSHRHFFLPNFTPTLFNLVVVASLGGYVLVAPANFTAGLYVLAVAPSIGIAAMAFLQLAMVYRFGYKPGIRLRHPALLPTVRLAGPMVLFVASTVGVQIVAYLLGTSFNAAPQLTYAFTIFSLPYGVFVVSIATALMPELSEYYARGDTNSYRSTLSFGLRTAAFIAVPASVGMVVLAKPIIGLLYERGSFTAGDTADVSALLIGYGVGLLGYAIYFVLVRSFYSRQNTRIPAALNVGMLGLYAVLAYALSEVIGLSGLALALSGASAVAALVALAAMRREIKRIDGRRLLRSLARTLAAGAVMCAVAVGGISLLGMGSEALERALIVAAVGSVSLGAYLAAAFLLGAEEMKFAVDLLKRRREEKQTPRQAP